MPEVRRLFDCRRGVKQMGKCVYLRRGVRQGDPLSPYLFILAIDAFARVIDLLAHNNFIEKPIGRMFVVLFYADDSMFMIKPDFLQVRRLKFVLNLFANSSGLTINFEKSEFIIISAQEIETEEFIRELGCAQTTLPFKYMGYPLHYKGPTREEYKDLIGKFEKRLKGWKWALLSKGGRLILINSVLSALPVYYFNVFKLPQWVLEAIDRIRRNFLWKGNKETGIPLVAWEVACKPKDEGV